MKNNKITIKVQIIILCSCIIVFVALLAVVMFFPQKDESPVLSEINEVEIKNIEINDFDEDGLGLLYNDKYYQIQYGVHLKDESYIGTYLGEVTGDNTLKNVEGKTYQYSDGSSYLIDEGAKYYSFAGQEDVILVESGDPTINNYWVLSPSILPSVAIFPLIDKAETCSVKVYPSLDFPMISYDMDSSAPFIKSIERVDDIDNSNIITCYITIDDNSGLLYGLIACINRDTGEVFLESPLYYNLKFKATDEISQYIAKYYYEINNTVE